MNPIRPSSEISRVEPGSAASGLENDISGQGDLYDPAGPSAAANPFITRGNSVCMAAMICWRCALRSGGTPRPSIGPCRRGSMATNRP